MTWSEALLAAAAILSALGAVGAVFYKRHQPELDRAAAAHELVNSKAVQTEIERSSRLLNAYRDQRTLDLELWGEQMRPVMYQIKSRDDVLSTLIKDAYARLGLAVPQIPPFPDLPVFPAPRPLP
jgi:hypothetical protein